MNSLSKVKSVKKQPKVIPKVISKGITKVRPSTLRKKKPIVQKSTSILSKLGPKLKSPNSTTSLKVLKGQRKTFQPRKKNLKHGKTKFI